MCKELRDYRDYRKRKLSASDSGRGIKVTATASPGTLVHTALSNISANEWDEVWLYAINTSAAAVKLTVQWGGTTAPDDEIEVTIAPEAGLVNVIPGLALQNSKEVRAYAATGSVLVLHGWVHRYENS